MQTIQRNICTVILFQIQLFCYIKGLQLYPASDLTAQSFTLVCDLQGTVLTNTIIFTYNGSSGGGCGSPPTPSCGSPIGTIASDSKTVNLTLNQNEIASKGNALWVCAHGTELAPLNTTVIALCTNIEVKYADEKIDISCSCGFPSVQAELEYKDGQNGNTLGSQTFDLSGSPGSNCTTDIRANDYSSKIADFPSGTVEVCATVTTYSQTTTPTTKCELVPDCSQDIFLYGFLPVFLIVLIASIAINILKIDFLSQQFGEFTWKKVGITAVFFVIAIIIGVCLGLLIKGCDKKLLALGLSLFFGILIVVALIFALIYYHKKCESGSDIQDGDGGEDSNRSSQNNTGSNTTRTGTGRVGSPASTSNVELAANLNRNKTDVPKGDQSALNQKAWQSPLPLPPVASQPPTASTHNLPLSRNNQLGPIAVENEEANSSEKKKKKKKKKKKRIVDEAEDNENES